MKKSARTRIIKTSCELPAGAGKFPPVTRRNRRQSVPAEIFACIRRYFYLRISLPGASAGNFARASFTVLSKFDLLSCRIMFLFAHFKHGCFYQPTMFLARLQDHLDFFYLIHSDFRKLQRSLSSITELPKKIVRVKSEEIGKKLHEQDDQRILWARHLDCYTSVMNKKVRSLRCLELGGNLGLKQNKTTL